MLYYLMQHKYEVYLAVLIPIISFYLKRYTSRSFLKVLLILSVILFIPIVFGYTYILGYLNIVIFYIIILSIWTLAFKSKNNTIKGLIINTGISIAIWLFIVFEFNIFGSIQIKNIWVTEFYKVEQVEERGFSGGPLKVYNLYEFNPIFVRSVDQKEYNDSTNNCIIKFNYKKFKFDKCKASASSINYFKINY